MLRGIVAVLVLAALGVLVAVAVGAADSSALVSLVPIAVGIGICGVFLRMRGGLDRLGRQVRELPTLGIGRRGIVRDALPYASAHGGAVFQPEGAQMVLRVELEREGGGPPETVSIHVVEQSDRAKARVGTQVTVLEHPDDRALRALDGFLPNGRPR